MALSGVPEEARSFVDDAAPGLSRDGEEHDPDKQFFIKALRKRTEGMNRLEIHKVLGFHRLAVRVLLEELRCR